MSITREVCKVTKSPNANPSHLHPKLRNPILRLVKSPQPSPDSHIALAQLRQGDRAVVSCLAGVAGLEDGQGSSAALLARLRDLGFIAGARCEVMARMWMGGDPMVVRVGGSTFALRRAEAAAVRVTRAV
jgi:ferrous iron transport protein A